MKQFSDRSFWTEPSVKWASDMLETDHYMVSQKDPFILELRKSLTMSKEQLQNFKSEYWPSLLTAIHHENPYLRTLVIDLMVKEKQSEVEKEIWHHWEDPFPLCRSLLIDRFQSQNRSKVFQELFILLTKDPLLWIRKKSAGRIAKDFPDLLTYQFENFDTAEKLHLLELLDSTITADRKIMENVFQSNDELSLWINYKLKNQEMLSDILLKEEYDSFRKKIDQSHYMISGDVLDVPSIKDQQHLSRILSSFGAMEDTSILEDFIYHGHELEGKEEEKDQTLNALISVLKKRTNNMKGSWLEALFQNYDWKDSNIGGLLSLIKKNSHQSKSFALHLLQDDDFIIQKVWVESLSKSFEDIEWNSLLFNIREAPMDSILFRNSLMVLMGGNKKRRLETVRACLERLYLSSEEESTLLELFRIAKEMFPENLQTSTEEIWKTFPDLKYPLLNILPEGMLSKLEDSFFEGLSFQDEHTRKKALENLLRIGRDTFLPDVLYFYEDPSREVRNFIQQFCKEGIKDQEKNLLQEWVPAQ